MAGELAFGAPFGMLISGKDSAQVPKSRAAGMAALESSASPTAYEEESIPAVATVHGRGDLLAFLGALPEYWRPYIRALPMFKRNAKAAIQFPNMAVAAIARKLEAQRLAEQARKDVGDEWDDDKVTDPADGDMLARLLQGKDETGEPMGAEELCAEALTLLVAGSDTTSK